MKQNVTKPDRSNAKVFNWIFGLAIVLVAGGIAWVGWRCIDSVQKKDSPRYEQAKKELSTQAVADQLSPTYLLQQSSNHNPVGSEIFYSRALDATDNRSYAQAEKDLSQVLVMIPEEAKKKTNWLVQGCVSDRDYYTRMVYQDRAFCYLQEGKYALAIADLDVAIKMYPDNLTNYKNRAKAHFLLGHKALAAADMKTARILIEKRKKTKLELDQ